MAASYAIVESGGKQYRAEKGAKLLVERLPADEGAKVSLRAVMFRDGKRVVAAAEELAKVKVEAVVAGHERGPKLRIFKYKPKKGYRRRAGHRQELTRLEVTEVRLLTRKPARAKAETKPADEKAEAKSKAQPRKAPAKQPAAKKPAAKKPAAKKAPARKPATKRKTTAKKPASGSKPRATSN
jgi:large subunit ribosomal protein L21